MIKGEGYGEQKVFHTPINDREGGDGGAVKQKTFQYQLICWGEGGGGRGCRDNRRYFNTNY